MKQLEDTAPAEKPDPAKGQPFGLCHWMVRVLEEADKSGQDLASDPVHDLRVALRRCRSIAEGFMTIDPDKTWGAMRREGKRLFRSLGKLRDVQVLQDWVRRLGGPDDTAGVVMLARLTQREQELKRDALEALQGFDREDWRVWMRQLDARTRRLPPGGVVFQLSALQAWNEAYELHKQALRNRSAASYHRLRIGLKKFRYTVENFLPLRHEEWARDLKDLQDWLGEAHDLSVLWNLAVEIKAFSSGESREHWRMLLIEERAKRIRQYRVKMVGRGSLWNTWREGLPPQNRLQSLSLMLIQKWADFHGISSIRSREVRRLALQLFDGLESRRSSDREETKTRRAILHAAAVIHEAGRGRGKKEDRKTAADLLLGLSPLPGFTIESLLLTGLIVRCSRGRFRGFDHLDFGGLPENQRRTVMELAAMLRLARTLARNREFPIRHIKAQRTGDSIVIFAEGYPEFGSIAEKAARSRYLLELAYQKPVIIRSMPVKGS